MLFCRQLLIFFVVFGISTILNASSQAADCPEGPIKVVAGGGRPLRLYLAGPLGFSEAGTRFKDCTIIPKLHALGYEVIDPWTLTAKEKIDQILRLPYGQGRRDAWKALDPEIARNNEAGINRADAILAVLDGTDVDSGTAAEIGYAYGRAKPILGYRGDFRLSADNEGSTVNLQVEYFIRQRGGEIITSLKDLPGALASFGANARLAAGLPYHAPAPTTFSEESVGARSNYLDAVKDVVRFFQSAFTVILALALGEAFKQFAADSSGGSGPNTLSLHWSRMWALLVLLFLLLPFFQGMSRYFFDHYESPSGVPQDYASTLLVDGFFFTLEAALFFVMSRALAPEHWKRFYFSVFCLLVADSVWALLAIYWHKAPVGKWLVLNLASTMVVGLLLWGRRKALKLPTLLNCALLLGAVGRTVLDYYFMWDFYFPKT
ncbi:MAG TPA: nucleoside 2-deoxyribosyltransferase [Rhizomicrobium sp.]|nr:nucleoside 2-deoxyribosyltransferase [Rhizomicrobium sp.]